MPNIFAIRIASPAEGSTQPAAGFEVGVLVLHDAAANEKLEVSVAVASDAPPRPDAKWTSCSRRRDGTYACKVVPPGPGSCFIGARVRHSPGGEYLAAEAVPVGVADIRSQRAQRAAP